MTVGERNKELEKEVASLKQRTRILEAENTFLKTKYNVKGPLAVTLPDSADFHDTTDKEDMSDTCQAEKKLFFDEEEMSENSQQKRGRSKRSSKGKASGK